MANIRLLFIAIHAKRRLSAGLSLFTTPIPYISPQSKNSVCPKCFTLRELRATQQRPRTN